MDQTEGEYDFFAEWAVWAHLNSKTDLELILLKGHLLLEEILNIKLSRNKFQHYENLSFNSKILSLEKVDFEKIGRKEFILSSLRDLNRLRNKLAHDYRYDLYSNGEFELWASRILENLKGKKYTRFTFRTKIVHAFSTLSINILESSSGSNNTPAPGQYHHRK